MSVNRLSLQLFNNYNAVQAHANAAPNPAAKLDEIEERLNRLRSPFRTAEAFWVDEVIDPRDTRKLLCDFATLAAPLRTPSRLSSTVA